MDAICSNLIETGRRFAIVPFFREGYYIFNLKNIKNMKKAFEAYQAGRISRDEMYRYQSLKRELMGESMFVVVGNTTKWREFNKLTKKISE